MSICMKLSTVLGEDTVKTRRASGLFVRGVGEPTEIPLPGCYIRDNIPVKETQIPKPETVAKWPHLAKIAGKLLPYKRIPVGNKMMVFYTSLCTLSRLNWAKQTPGIMRRNE